jgi:hypothetical protein
MLPERRCPAAGQPFNKCSLPPAIGKPCQDAFWLRFSRNIDVLSLLGSTCARAKGI